MAGEAPEGSQFERNELTMKGIQQYYINVGEEERKLDQLLDLFSFLLVTQSVVFVNTSKKAEWLADKLRAHDYTVLVSHGDMDQNARDISIREFHSRSSRVLVTTDDFPRVIDRKQVPVVINYDLPTQPEKYLLNVGGRGCFAPELAAVSFATQDDERMISDIQKFYNVIVDELRDV